MIKVLDFGLAKLEGLADRVALRGSPGYASPEQLQPGRNVDPRADVWALGVILFEFVSGKLPFDAPKLTEMLAITTERPPHPLTSPRGPLPAAFERIVLRCLTPNPDGRFANVGELAEALLPMGPSRMRPYLKRIFDQLNGVRQTMTFGDTTTKVPATASLSLDASASMLTEDTRASESLVLAGTEGPVTAPLGGKRDALIVAEVLPRRSWVSAALAIALAVALPTAAAIWRTSRSKPPAPPESAAATTEVDPVPDPVTQIEVYAPPARDAAAAPVAPTFTPIAPALPTVVAGGGVLPAMPPRRPNPPPLPPKPQPAPHQNPASHPNPLTYR
jgi:serine/threonine-protein kinase